MKVCMRCGHQGDANVLQVEVLEGRGATAIGVLFRQGFDLCAECETDFFERLSEFVSDADVYSGQSQPEDGYDSEEEPHNG